MQAARDGDAGAVLDLLKRGATVNQVNGNGGTALMYAAVGGHAQIVDALIRHGADVNARGRNGWGALMIACAKGRADIVESLLAAGAGANLPDLYGWTPLMRAVYEQRSAVMAELMAVADLDLDAVTEHGSTALHLAAIVGDRNTARQLLARGASADLQDYDGRTVADIAEARGDPEFARLLRDGSPSSAARARHG